MSSRAKRFSPYQNIYTGSETLQCVMGLSPHKLKQQVHKANHSTPHCAEGKNGWSYISAFAICLHSVQRDKFTSVTLTYLSTSFSTIFNRECDRYIGQNALDSESSAAPSFCISATVTSESFVLLSTCWTDEFPSTLIPCSFVHAEQNDLNMLMTTLTLDKLTVSLALLQTSPIPH